MTWNRHDSPLDIMFEMPVATCRTNMVPAILFDHFDRISDFHRLRIAISPRIFPLVLRDSGPGLAVGLAAALGFALVPVLFAFGDSQFALDPPIAEIKPGGDERMSLELRLSHEFAYLLLVQEEFSRPERIVVAEIAVGIRPNMGIQQESLAIFDDSVGVFQVSFAFTDRFHFSPPEGDSALEAVEEEVVMARGTIDGGIAFSGRDRIAGLLFRGSLTDRMCGLAGHCWRAEFSC